MMKKKEIKLYLKAADIPRSCNECFLGERYGCVGDVKCKALDEYFTGNVKPPYKERPDECPLAELPERHGAWKLIDHFAPYQACSACGFVMPIAAGENVREIRLYRYCPNCGARMDGGDGRERATEDDGGGHESQTGGAGLEPVPTRQEVRAP